MHEKEKKIIDLGVIDIPISELLIDDWFENMYIKLITAEDVEIKISFENCFEILLKHDKSYSKGKLLNGKLDYQYFVQDIEVIDDEGFYKIKISAWPLDCDILCRKVEIELHNIYNH